MVDRCYPHGAKVQEIEDEDENDDEDEKIMPLKFKCEAKEEIPAELQGLYVERDGGFMLDVEGAVDKARVDEFRASNVALASQLAEQRKRFEAIESEQVKSIAAERDSLNAKLTAILVDQGVLTVATKKGLWPTARSFNRRERRERREQRSRKQIENEDEDEDENDLINRKWNLSYGEESSSRSFRRVRELRNRADGRVVAVRRFGNCGA
jgi:hypothetical protein